MTWTVIRVRVAQLLKGQYTVVLTVQNEEKQVQDLFPNPNWSFNSWTDVGKSHLPTTFTSFDEKVHMTLALDSDTFQDMFRKVASIFG